MNIPADCAQLSVTSLDLLRSLIGYSLSGRVTEPHLSLRLRGHFTSAGVYDAAWDDFIIEPKKNRFSKRQDDVPPALWCHVVQTEIDGALVLRMVVETLPAQSNTMLRTAGHAVGAVAMFPVQQIQILSSSVSFLLADVYDSAPPVPADVGIRFMAVSPAGHRCGFALLVKPGSAALYFQAEDGSPIASVQENAQRRDILDVRTTLE